jgi:hypothetical protein
MMRKAFGGRLSAFWGFQFRLCLSAGVNLICFCAYFRWFISSNDYCLFMNVFIRLLNPGIILKNCESLSS